MVKCGPNNGYYEKQVLKKIGLRVPNMCKLHFKLNSQCSEGGIYDHVLSTRIFTLIINVIFIQVPKDMRKVARALIWIC